jgi:hypothetical protein
MRLQRLYELCPKISIQEIHVHSWLMHYILWLQCTHRGPSYISNKKLNLLIITPSEPNPDLRSAKGKITRWKFNLNSHVQMTCLTFLVPKQKDFDLIRHVHGSLEADPPNFIKMRRSRTALKLTSGSARKFPVMTQAFDQNNLCLCKLLDLRNKVTVQIPLSNAG